MNNMVSHRNLLPNEARKLTVKRTIKPMTIMSIPCPREILDKVRINLLQLVCNHKQYLIALSVILPPICPLGRFRELHPVLFLKTRYPSGSQPFTLVGVPEQALGGFPLAWIYFGIEVSCNRILPNFMFDYFAISVPKKHHKSCTLSHPEHTYVSHQN